MMEDSSPLASMASLSIALLDSPVLTVPQQPRPTESRAKATPIVALNAAPPKKAPSAAALGAAPRAGDGVLPAEKQSGAVWRNEPAAPTVTGMKAAGSTFPRFGWSRRHNANKPPRNDIAGAHKASLVWFRSDLRVHDNEVLNRAHADSASVVPVYVFDPTDYGKSSSGFDKTGPYRAQFLIECVKDLRRQLKKIGSELVVRVGQPAEVLARLVKETGATALYSHSEVTAEESQLENKVQSAVKDMGAELKLFWGSTLYHLEDLPFTLEQMPTTYGSFRERVQNVKIRPTLKPPTTLKGFPAGCSVDFGDVPTLKQLGLSASAKKPETSTSSPKQAHPTLIGGENEALHRLKNFVNDRLKSSKGTAQLSPAPTGANFSCKISPWLAMGCLSPRHMYAELWAQAGKGKKGEGKGDNGMNWLVFELLWRDFFRFITKKHSTVQTPKTAPARPHFVLA
uniref:Photolyase/cryptochrome alpha/beta domain-containing protein n=1 Tax=Pyramimonas obovata TaxID=1411642 RepID=A0A7S0N2B6_9CHLO|mmetsp:Transcript_17360/g.37780  ORF Transcript_17360/g.37780 Transcript_17360/m.37780 type:complete len:455 (+) Transcript_17360:99-1463(+)|eukprot:CAMPEP_0118926024 /NCGR_PEP_ID=MMETSP1169-20130426/3820_1 /TAXON_ID=36882 /ORGANISM="Pyramimonas obovata, Strain CCMP722" /LENGTH=454 /DNA_ID=CAMNT_0006867487 /DNA_START=89 /DNA_END=1453 /DNA_ORIENTATION=-